MKLIIKYKQAEWLTGNMPNCRESVIRKWQCHGLK